MTTFRTNHRPCYHRDILCYKPHIFALAWLSSGKSWLKSSQVSVDSKLTWIAGIVALITLVTNTYLLANEVSSTGRWCRIAMRLWIWWIRLCDRSVHFRCIRKLPSIRKWHLPTHFRTWKYSVYSDVNEICHRAHVIITQHTCSFQQEKAIFWTD